MDQILDFSKPFNVALFDQVVGAMFGGNPQDMQQAQKVLTQFRDHPNSWTKVKTILEQSTSPNSKYMALQVLEQVVQYKWKILPTPEREGVKNFIIITVINSCKDEKGMQTQKLFVNKLNEVLVQIVKQEWPHNWRNFIPEIVNSSKQNEVICRNNMKILKLLSEEVFDFSGGKLTQDKIEELKNGFQNDFALIYQLCEFILEKASSAGLIVATLQTLQSFITWIPHKFIFETKLLEALITKFLPVHQFRNDTLRCLSEIAQINDQLYLQKYEVLFCTVMERMNVLLPFNTNIPKAYKDGSDYDQQFIQLVALFFTTLFKNQLAILEKDQFKQFLVQAHLYLVAISEVDDKELFKTCLEYWNFLTQELYFSEKSSRESMNQSRASNNYGLMLNTPVTQNAYLRKQVYADVLSNLRIVLISKMAKPEEVIIVEDENGQIVKEYMKDVDSIALYKQMKETLVYLTHLDFADTERIMTRKLQEQVNGINWSWNNLNTLCWAIGSISGAMDVRDEKRFLVAVIKDLLNLCENKRGKDNKAVVASNIMYVVGQYPRFLIDHWKFLKTVVNKLFEFMHELFPGVQEMACETFVKISKKCRRKFVTMQMGETRLFIEDMLQDLPSIIKMLEPAHIQIFFEAVGYMISSAEAQQQEVLIQKLMQMPNQRWQAIMQQAGQNMTALTNADNIRDLVNLLKTNVSAAKAIGASFITQMTKIYREMLEVYKAYSRIISEEIKRIGPQATQYQTVKSMRAVKKEILKLTETFIVTSKNAKVVVEHFVPLLLEATLGDYHTSVPDARDPGVLSLLAVTMNKLKDTMIKDLPKILESVLECTLPMITKNFEDYPEHRANLFNLLRAINKHCFQAFFDIPPSGFKLVIDSVLWSVKHNHVSIYETGLNILLELMTNVEKLNNPDALANFHRSFFLQILNDVFYVLTDTFHKSGFEIQATILYHMFGLVQSGRLNVPVYDTKAVQHLISNQEFIKEHISTVLSTNFRNLTKQQVGDVIVQLFGATGDEGRFKSILKDFLVQMKEFSEHFLQEELERRKKQTEALKQQLVPGLGDQQTQQDSLDSTQQQGV